VGGRSSHHRRLSHAGESAGSKTGVGAWRDRGELERIEIRVALEDFEHGFCYTSITKLGRAAARSFGTTVLHDGTRCGGKADLARVPQPLDNDKYAVASHILGVEDRDRERDPRGARPSPMTFGATASHRYRGRTDAVADLVEGIRERRRGKWRLRNGTSNASSSRPTTTGPLGQHG